MTRRHTRQRAAIRRAFEAQGRPLSAPEVLELARPEVPGIGAATVYRAIHSLLDEGFLAPVVLPGQPPRYELAGMAHHHHFHCTACGRVFDLAGCLSGLQALVPHGFRVSAHDIILSGHCPDCSA
ncbi:MAG: transcriptional repressor [Acidobacteria bacterium]|nr:transcriptional repressor [Acidobacteriota bacterium]